ncbi:DUF3078 domain-containing protein [Aridibaculum aurantiacum]|uniref:DUF3078 domain-containing protein n=1 Tax=Aridibaculum aurantiacum TaxID=2810307 RepID=UPI001A96D66E|nr:DUF3078 domain-containing protein [Aridibaculum aurantiacum]
MILKIIFASTIAAYKFYQLELQTMRKLILTALYTSACIGLTAQPTSSTTRTTTVTNKTTSQWKRGGMVSVSLSQGGTRNWAPGGDRFTLAANGFLNLYANHTKGNLHWDNMLDANFGFLNSNKFGIVKNDDKLDFVSRLTRQIGTTSFRYGAWGNFRTQFADGYDYDGDIPKRISAFLAPGIASVSLGVDYYGKGGAFNLHVGPHARWIIVANRPYELAANYNVQPNREVKIEAGAMASVGYNKEIIPNVTYRSRLDVFSDGLDHHPGNVDIFWTNMFHLKVNRYLGVVYNFDLQYDDDTQIFGYEKSSPGTQLKSILGVGLSVKF